MKVTPISTEQWLKVGKATLWVGTSAMLSYLLTALASHPEAFGALTPIVNVVLVTLKQLITKE